MTPSRKDEQLSRRQLLKIVGAGSVIAAASIGVGSQLADDEGPGPVPLPDEMTPTPGATPEQTEQPLTAETADVLISPDQNFASALADTDEGDRIWLAPGVHEIHEPGIEMKPGQHLKTESGTIRIRYSIPSGQFTRAIKVPDKVIIEGVLLDAAGNDAHGFDVWGSDCVVRNCEVTGFQEGHYPVNIYKGDRSRIVQNRFYDNDTRGCAVTGALEQDDWATDCLVADNVFERNRDGVKLRGAKNCVVRNNHIRPADGADGETLRGVLLQARDHPNQGNVIEGNRVFAPENTAGVIQCVSLPPDRDGDNYTSEGNVFRDNVLVGGDFTIFADNQARFENNIILNRTRYLSLVGERANITIIGGTIGGQILNRGGQIEIKDVVYNDGFDPGPSL